MKADPDAAAAPLGEDWWSSVTPDELGRSAGLVAGLVDPKIAGPIDPTHSARALAVRQLCVDDSALVDALRAATERTRADDRAVRNGGDTAEAKTWLAHCKPLGDAFDQAIALLAPQDMARRQELRGDFDTAVSRLRSVLIEIEIKNGIGGGIRPSRRFDLPGDKR